MSDEKPGQLPAIPEPDPERTQTGGDLRPYLEKITAEHNQQPRFMRTIWATLKPAADALVVARELPTLHDIDVAVGVQLDAVGEWVGLSRRITVVEESFFSWDIEDRGWDEEGAPWLGPFADDRSTVVLDDDYYRLVLKARIAANMWDGTKDGAYDAWHKLFAPLGYRVLIQENYDKPFQYLMWDEDWAGWDEAFWDLADLEALGRVTGTMHMTMILLGPPPDKLLTALFTGGYFDLRPAGVGIGYLTTQSDPSNPSGVPIFAWDEGPEGAEWKWFSWDEPEEEELGWDEADWLPVEGPDVPTEFWFTWDGDELEGWDSEIAEWLPAAGPLGTLPAVIGIPQPDYPLLLAGWDIGAWARELEPTQLRTAAD